MTDRVNGFIVTLEKPIRDDDVEAIRKAILMVKGVISVKNRINTSADEMARIQVETEIMNKLYSSLRDIFSRN